MVDKWTVGLNKEGLYNGVKPPEERDQRKKIERTLRKSYCSIRKNTIGNNHFIQEPIPRTPLEITNSSKNLLLGPEIITYLCFILLGQIPNLH